MACSCQKGNGFVVTKPDGSTVERKTEIEARALAIRTGGSYKAK